MIYNVSVKSSHDLAYISSTQPSSIDLGWTFKGDMTVNHSTCHCRVLTRLGCSDTTFICLYSRTIHMMPGIGFKVKSSSIVV